MLKKVTILSLIGLVCLSVFHKTVIAESYTVQPGDTLLKISDKFGTSTETIANLNQLQSTILNPNKYLEVPDSYIVKEGDTLYKVAIQLGIPLPELIEANPSLLTFPFLTWIYPGQKINKPIQHDKVYLGDSSKKRMALTFDDGPEDTYTPEILEILKKKNVKATFFVLGERAKEYPEIVEQIHEEGHVIGNHTWDHPHLPELEEEQFIDNIQSASEEIEEIIGIKPNLFRPPFGEIEDHQLELLHNRGYKAVMWSADTKDWSGISAEEIVSTVMKEANPGVIVLQHNYHASGPFETVEALPQMIDELRAEGYEFVTVPEIVKD
ncbi:polysaccharide deacetylase family sporulation protein PdaB/delta-lactam-biosynthetic de-N-acetylase,TIGR02884 [Gracilibacillus orientalis]|uniref:Polysaccharide deacetylase family sporulation protein PdaB/delta-lactam-biosynthetic de-N-acetylase,TIGR02884 n=1 Tax=Gracilibacillus orientalis TaxID=334253 RepID=A0A1I4JL18_9BACI|nr:polysaccharide deacetylase family protein [Gracilibacillus orientalis]SFL67250.1 polysaccharide deacetylase family sporulation protein PdaB/delta-lactam-biosynthetic de-N-acetylase,TIGR02884 [Gracilibacillus orientalis]